MQATHDILEGSVKIGEKEAVKLAALQYCLQPLTAKLLAQMCILVFFLCTQPIISLTGPRYSQAFATKS